MPTTIYVPTTREVAVAIRKAHPNLGTYAIASGEEWSPYAETWWSLPGAPAPSSGSARPGTGSIRTAGGSTSGTSSGSASRFLARMMTKLAISR